MRQNARSVTLSDGVRKSHGSLLPPASPPVDSLLAAYVGYTLGSGSARMSGQSISSGFVGDLLCLWIWDKIHRVGARRRSLRSEPVECAGLEESRDCPFTTVDWQLPVSHYNPGRRWRCALLDLNVCKCTNTYTGSDALYKSKQSWVRDNASGMLSLESPILIRPARQYNLATPIAF